MADANKPSMSGGVLDPKARARVDLSRYYNSLKTARNFFIEAQGGASNRSGQPFVGRTRGTSFYGGSAKTHKSRNIPFQFNVSQNYQLEFSDLYFRIIRDGGYVLEPTSDAGGTITAVTKADPGVVTITGHNFLDDDWVFIDSALGGMVELQNRTVVVKNKAANTFELVDEDGANIDTTSFTTFTSGGTGARIKTVVTEYLASEIDILDFDQVADTMTITHENHEPREITRGVLGHHDFSISDIVFAPLVNPPTALQAVQDFEVSITGFQADLEVIGIFLTPGSAALFKVGQRVWVEDVVGTVEINDQWWVVSFIDDINSPPIYMNMINTDGTAIDTTAWTAWISGGKVYEQEKIKYRITSIDEDTGEESLGSEEIVIEHAMDLSRADAIVHINPPAGATPVRTQKISQYTVYKEKNGIFGFIGTMEGKVPNEDWRSISGVTITGVGVPVIFTTATAHGYEMGDEIFFVDNDHEPSEIDGESFVVHVLTTTTFNVKGFRGGDFDGTAPPWTAFSETTQTITGITNAKPAVVTATSHPFVETDIIYIENIVGMTEVNTLLFSVGTTTTNTFELNDLDGNPIDSTGFGTFSSGGTNHARQRMMTAPSPYVFHDDNIDPALNDVAPPTEARNPFDGPGKFPRNTAFHEQRRLFGRTDDEIQKAWGTQIGNIYNMNKKDIVTVDDAIDFTLPSKQANEVRHMVSLEQLFLFTSGNEWVSTSGDNSYIAENIRNRIHTTNGVAAFPAPIIVNKSILYVQGRGNAIWDLSGSPQAQSFTGQDRSLLAQHFFRNRTIVSWDYAHIPHRIVWAVRDDGVMLSMTYLPEHEIWAWTEHSTDGKYEDVSVIAEGEEDVPYFIVKRTIDGKTVRFVERQAARNIESLQDACFVDAGASLDVPIAISAVSSGSKVITAITQANPGVVTAVDHGFNNGHVVKVIEVVGMTEVNGLSFLVANKTDDTFELTDLTSSNVDTTAFTAYTSDGLAGADPVVVTLAASHGIINGNYVDIDEIVARVAGATQNSSHDLNLRQFRVGHVATNDVWLTERAINPSGGDKAITGITQANPGVVTSVAHGFLDGQVVHLIGIEGMVEANDTFYRVANKAADTFELNTLADAAVDTTAFTAYTIGGRAEPYKTLDGTTFAEYIESGNLRKAVNSVRGLNHLEGETVAVLANGSVFPQQTVTGGMIDWSADDTLQRASRIHIGLPYTAELETLPLNNPEGALTGKQRSNIEVIFNLYRTRGIEVGPNSLRTVPHKERDTEGYYQFTVFSENEQNITIPSDWDQLGSVYVKTLQPLPATIQSIGVNAKASNI